MRILTDENIFKISYFKNICPGYEQFFEPEKLFLRLTDDPAELKRRQNILRDLLENPELFDDLCFILETVMQFKTAFDDMPNHDLGDFRLNLECFEDADGAIGLLDRFLKTAEYAARYEWLSGFAAGMKQLAQRRSADKTSAAWEQAYVPEIIMHACDFGFNLDGILWPTNYKLLSMREQEYTKKNVKYKIEHIKKPMLDRIQSTIMVAKMVILPDGNGHPFQLSNDERMAGHDSLIFGENSIKNRTKILNSGVSNNVDVELDNNYLITTIAIYHLLNRAAADAPSRIKYFVTSLIGELEPLVTEFVPYLCAAKTALYWHKKGIAYSIPEIGKPGEVVIQGLINPYIAQNEGVDTTIENSVNLNSEIAVVTGANRGGKTAFVTSVTLCQLLFQLGFPIPAKSAELGVFSGIVSVFAGEEQGLIGTGRLGEELKKLAAALTAAKEENTFVCLNEPLTGTSSRDGEHILCEALCILKQAGATGFVVTHLLGLAKAIDRINEAGGSPLVTLTAQTDGDKPLYKIIPAPAADTSHAKAVVKRFIS